MSIRFDSCLEILQSIRYFLPENKDQAEFLKETFIYLQDRL